jgi:hypothetical protein
MATVSKINKKKIAEKVLPKKTEPTYTRKFTEGAKKIDANVKKGALKGSGVVPSNDEATLKPYEKKFIPAGNGNTYAKIIDGQGKVVKTADNKVGANTSNERLRAEFLRDSTNTMNRRKANLNFVKVNTGKKQNLTQADLKMLLDLSKIKGNKS